MAKRQFEDLSYTLHFHSLSHSISANYYQELDQGLCYLSTLATALVIACGGTLVVSLGDNGSRIKAFATLVTIASTIATEAISKINSSDHAPGKNKALHHEAAWRLRELRKQVGYFLNVMEENQHDLEKRFHEFLSEQSRIEKECPESESWTFPKVHNELSPNWKTLGEKLKKFFPNKESQAYRYVSPKWIFFCGIAVAFFCLWKITLYIA